MDLNLYPFLLIRILKNYYHFISCVEPPHGHILYGKTPQFFIPPMALLVFILFFGADPHLLVTQHQRGSGGLCLVRHKYFVHLNAMHTFT